MNALERSLMLPVFRDGRALAYGLQFQSAKLCDETIAALPHLEKFRGERLAIKADRAEYQPGQRCHELVFHAESINGNGDGRFFASALTDFSTEKPGLLLERLYHVVAICENAGDSKVYLTSAPVKHHLACVMMSKFSSHPARRLQLEEVSSTTRPDQGVSNVIG